MADIDGFKEKYKDDRFFQEIFESEIYGPAKGYTTVIDLGATAGEFGVWIYDSASRIYALEPNSKHFEELKENIEKYNLKKIKPYRIAIGAKNEERYITVGDRGASSLGTKDTADTEMVPGMTLASFIRQFRINFVDILKIDVESAEYEIFTAPDFGSVAHKIRLIIGELHIEGTEIFSILRDFGFEVSHIGNRCSMARK